VIKEKEENIFFTNECRLFTFCAESFYKINSYSHFQGKKIPELPSINLKVKMAKSFQTLKQSCLIFQTKYNGIELIISNKTFLSGKFSIKEKLK